MKHNISAAEYPVYSNDNHPCFIENLRERDFTGSQVNIVGLVEKNHAFNRYLISYKSDNLTITGMMNVPHGKGPFPVAILNHGHYDPQKYFSVGYGFKDAADIFSRNGYVAVGSDFRNHGGSDAGDPLGTINDVLFLIEAVKKLPYVNKEKIVMWGYSGGGSKTLTAAVVSKDIKALAIFGSMSSDETDNYYAIRKWNHEKAENMSRVFGKPDEKPENYAKLSPINYIDYFSAKAIIHHGEDDNVVPIGWSKKLKNSLVLEGKTVEYHVYPRQKHVITGKDWAKAMERTISFFKRHL